MSTSMYWRPVPKDLPEPESVSGVKRLLAERLWGHDGSLRAAASGKKTLSP
jgi:hypothetical protein